MPISAPPPSWASIKNKPTTVAGYGITDMGSQSVNYAASAGNASTVSSITTAQVTAAQAGASAGGVGTYGLFTVGGTYGPGATLAGSSLSWADAYGNTGSGTASGTWRCMARSNSGTWSTVWLRIS